MPYNALLTPRTCARVYSRAYRAAHCSAAAHWHCRAQRPTCAATYAAMRTPSFARTVCAYLLYTGAALAATICCLFFLAALPALLYLTPSCHRRAHACAAHGAFCLLYRCSLLRNAASTLSAATVAATSLTRAATCYCFTFAACTTPPYGLLRTTYRTLLRFLAPAAAGCLLFHAAAAVRMATRCVLRATCGFTCHHATCISVNALFLPARHLLLPLAHFFCHSVPCLLPCMAACYFLLCSLTLYFSLAFQHSMPSLPM